MKTYTITLTIEAEDDEVALALAESIREEEVAVHESVKAKLAARGHGVSVTVGPLIQTHASRPPAAQYNCHRIAWELELTAMGDGYGGNALRAAKDLPGLTDEDRALLDRYATGTQTGTDHIALQTLALRIDQIDTRTSK